MTTWHVFFDGEPELIGHVCTWHKNVGGGIQCSDMDESGNCAHVQIKKCDCIWAADCTACLVEREGLVA